MFIFQIKRIISSEKWFNYVVTSCFESAKNLGRSDDAKRRKKKRGWPNENLNSAISIKRLEPNRNLTSAEADECFMV